MFKVLNESQKIALLKDFLRKPSAISARDIDRLLESFPFESARLNYLSLQVFRARKDIVPPEKLSSKLGINTETAKEILGSEERYAVFPVVNPGNRKAQLVKALLVPIRGERVILIGGEPPENLSLLAKLSGTGFAIAFSSEFDWKGSSSYMLSVYASLAFHGKFRDLAFTGVITPEGELEEVSFLREKREFCKKEGIPLVYPSSCMKDLRDLEGFILSLSIPLASLPSTDPSPFLREFKFEEAYIRDVFHLSYPLIYGESFEETVESFGNFADWLEVVSTRLKSINENYLPIKVGITSKVLAMTFYLGSVLAKSRLPVDFYQYDRGTYRVAFSLSSDRDVPDTQAVEKLVSVSRPKDVKEIFVNLKTKIEGREDALEIKLPEGEHHDDNLLELAFYVSREIKSVGRGCKKLHLEVSNPFSFALGYFLEDYVCLELVHKGKVVYALAPSEDGHLYLLNAFSLNMLEKGKALVDIEELSMQEAVRVLDGGYESYISHGATAQVLSKMLRREVQLRREPIKLKAGDRALVFQIKKRPAEGQVFTEEEIEDIVKANRFSFFLIKVFY